MEQKNTTQQNNEELFKSNMSRFVDAVKEEQLKREKGYSDPRVSSSAPLELQEGLQALVDIQLSKGSFTRKDIPKDLNYKIMTFASKRKISFKEAISLLIENDRYMSPEEIDVQNIADLIVDIRETYKACEKKYGGLPINALSEQSRNYLSNKKIKLNLKDKLKIMIDLYCPELSDVKIIERSNLFSQDKYFVRDDQLLQNIAGEIREKFTNKHGSVDALFDPENEQYLTDLLTVLHENRISFDEFIKQVAGLEYTECYSLESFKALKKMIETYHMMTGTYRGITTNDPYLRTKIDMVQEQHSTFDLGSLLQMYGIVNNDVMTNHQQLSPTEIHEKEQELLNRLCVVYPEKVIDKGFSVVYPGLYDSALELSKRYSYPSVDAYLNDRGFKRVNDYMRASTKKDMTLSEFDLFNYGFLYPSITEQEIIDMIQTYNLEILPVELNRAAYARLISQKRDSRTSKTYHNVPKKVGGEWGE